MVVDQSIDNALKQVYFKSRHSGNGSGSGRGSYARLDITCHTCGKKGHIQKDCRSKGNGSSWNSPKKSTNELPEWMTQKPVVSDTKHMIKSTINRNNKKYMWCTFFNNGQGEWLFHWKDSHEEWKEKQVKNKLVHFSGYSANAVIY